VFQRFDLGVNAVEDFFSIDELSALGRLPAFFDFAGGVVPAGLHFAMTLRNSSEDTSLPLPCF